MVNCTPIYQDYSTLAKKPHNYGFLRENSGYFTRRELISPAA